MFSGMDFEGENTREYRTEVVDLRVLGEQFFRDGLELGVREANRDVAQFGVVCKEILVDLCERRICEGVSYRFELRSLVEQVGRNFFELICELEHAFGCF